MKIILKLSLIVLAVTFSIQLKAQNTYPVTSSSIETSCISNCIDADSIPYISDSTAIRVVMTCQLFEVTGITSLHVKLGTTNGGSDLLDKTFAFDVSGNVGNGCTYSRTDYTVTLGLGDYNGLTDYFSELVLERNDHSLSDPLIFNR